MWRYVSFTLRSYFFQVNDRVWLNFQGGGFNLSSAVVVTFAP